MKNIKLIIIYIITSILCFDISVGQDADSTQYETDEVIITATRTEQKLIDIPFSVQRVDQTQWKTSRKMGMNDVLSNIPGLWLQPRYGNHDVRVSIRGYGTRSNTGIRGVRILVDGIPESEPDGQTRVEALDFTAISKIEVAKGNLTSLYTNAPGGVINFFSDKFFPRTFVMLDNEFGEYNLRKNGLKVGVNGDKERFMATYSYQNYRGYRVHSQEYQNRFNSVYEADLNPVSKLSIYGYFVKGLIKLPGSLTLAQYNKDDLAANSRDLSRDAKRQSNKGRVAFSYNTKFGKTNNNFIEVTGYGTIKELTRVAATYRIFNRWGIGSSFKYINESKVGDRVNEFSVGGDLYFQTGPISEFDNIGGIKGDDLDLLTDETISNVGFYFTDQIPIIKGKMNLLFTGRYDRIVTRANDLLAGFKDTSRLFDKFTPKAALNFKLNSRIALYGSFGLGFDSPANNELDNYPFSSDGGLKLLNPDLNAQSSKNFELGFKGDLPNRGSKIFPNTFFDMTFFNTKINDAIIPFTVDGTAYYRNAATVTRTGFEIGINSDVTKGLKLKGAYTYSDFKYDTYSARSIDATGQITDENYSGNKEPANPDNIISAELSYEHTFARKYTVFIKGNVMNVGSMFVNDKNVDSLKTEAYTLIGSQLGISFDFNNLRMLAFAGLNNITDEKYVSFVQINSDRQEYYESGPRRNFFSGINLSYMFNR